MSILGRSFRQAAKARTSGQEPDPNPASRAQADSLLVAFETDVERNHQDRKRAISAIGATDIVEQVAAADFPGGRAILEADSAVQVAVVRAAVDRYFPPRPDRDDLINLYYAHRKIGELCSLLFRRKLAYDAEDVSWLLERVANARLGWYLLEFAPIGIQGLIRSIERWSRDHELPEPARASLVEIRENIDDGNYGSQARKALDLIAGLLGAGDDRYIDTSDDWGHYATAVLGDMAGEAADQWSDFLAFSASIKGVRPPKKWISEAAERVERLGEPAFVEGVMNLLSLLDRATRNVHYQRPDGFDYPSAWIADRNTEVVKGLVWAATTVEDDALTAVLGDAALACYKKIPNYGARSTRAGNACVHALAAVPTVTAIAQLQRILQRVKLPSQRNQVELALASAADAQALELADLEELLVPGFDLNDGALHRVVGDYAAEVVIQGSDSVELRWLRPDGKPQKSVPAPVKRDFPGQVKDLKRTQKEIREALATQRSRLERLMIQDRSWDVAAWRERYLDHPLVSNIARRLIWTVECDERSVEVAWADGELVDLNDLPIGHVDTDARVRLWHPIEADAGTVLAWREWLARHEISQPFKQAHREIYVLTDAERETETYSNRFAAHIIRQHQFSALCQQRGWIYRLQGAWDGFNVPSIGLSDAGLRAEYWIEPVDDDNAVSHSYIYLYTATDQVRFVDVERNLPVPLVDVEPRVFSEVMRDVDLFVAVSSIGADPLWFDGGAERMAGYQDYWWDVSFGELSATAETRRGILAGLLPRLSKLEGRWELDGRFLKIRGDLRSYKIHLGSGNILMEPNDQYLCIVPGRGAGGSRSGDGLFLPFEGDQTLSVIISKALMLADDASIADPMISGQISGEPLRPR